MEYKGRYKVFDPGQIVTYPVSERTNKVRLDDLVEPDLISEMTFSLSKEVEDNIDYGVIGEYTVTLTLWDTKLEKKYDEIVFPRIKYTPPDYPDYPGYAIIVAGEGGHIEKTAIDHSANNAYRVLRNLGFDDDHIFYLNSNGPQDVDGDGDDDIAVYRPSNGNWYILGQVFTSWGLAGDLPVPGDYDGDGAWGIAVLRSSNGKWYIRGGDTVWHYMPGDYPLPVRDTNADGDPYQ